MEKLRAPDQKQSAALHGGPVLADLGQRLVDQSQPALQRARLCGSGRSYGEQVRMGDARALAGVRNLGPQLQGKLEVALGRGRRCRRRGGVAGSD
jgi:hypothetical protein